MKLLIADDQISVHRYLNKVIKFDELGIEEVYHSYDGQDTLKHIRSKMPDLMLLDIEMPELNGLEVLKEIFTNHWNTQTIILSAYAQFEYAKRALQYGAADYILKPIDPAELNQKLKHFIENYLHTRREALSSQILTLFHTSPTDAAIEDLNALLRENRIAQYCFLCTQSHSPFDFSIFRKYSWEVQCEIHPGSEQFFFVSSTLDPKQTSGMETVLNELPQIPNTGISSVYHDGAQLHLAVFEARAALFQTFYASGGSFYQSDFFTHPSLSANIPYYNSIINAAKDRDIANALFLAEKLFHYFLSNRIYPLTVYEICYKILTALDSHSRSFIRFSPEKPYEETFLSIYPDIQALKEHFLKILQSYLNSGEISAETDETVIRNIKCYVDEHCENDLSLDAVASIFFINKYQISRLFKKLYHINYHDYCLNVRLEKTCWLLRNTNLKIYEIAQQTGFKEESYLSYVFKRKYHMTLKEYRNQN